MRNPCKGCEDREVGCHADCKRYADWKVEKDRLREERSEYLEKSFARAIWPESKRKRLTGRK